MAKTERGKVRKEPAPEPLVPSPPKEPKKERTPKANNETPAPGANNEERRSSSRGPESNDEQGSNRDDAVFIEDNEETNAAAIKLQALQRGRAARKKMNDKEDGGDGEAPLPKREINDSSEHFKKFKALFEPLTEPQAADERRKEWDSVDDNASNRISLAEFDGWIQDVLKAKYGTDEGMEIWRVFRPSYIRAFLDACDICAESGDDDYVTFREFRLCIVYLVAYTNLLDAFSSVDGGTNGVTGEDDDRITREEFLSAASAFEATPFVAFDSLVGREEEIFHEINLEGDLILFSELCKYAKKVEIEKDTKLGGLLSKGDDEEHDV